jgi:hypothetical protein
MGSLRSMPKDRLEDKMSNLSVIIDLCDYGRLEETVYAILLDERGPIYSNQTGGVSCLHPEERGFLVPLCDYIVVERLCHLFESSGGLTEYLADEADKEFGYQFYNKRIGFKVVVDRDRMNESHEAWVYVKIFGWKNEEKLAVLTWENSD